MRQELISIIIPVYHVERYLKKCVWSVLKQTYKNFEIILVDDGSGEPCASMCDDFKKIDRRIRVYHKKNGGLSDARNFGILKSNGTYICFLDSDDYLNKKYLETLYLFLKKYDADVAFCNFYHVTPNGKKYSDTFITEKNQIVSFEHCYESTSSFIDVAWNKLYQKKMFEGIKFPYKKFHEDMFTTYKVLKKAKRIVAVNKNLYLYRIRDDGITGGKSFFIHKDIEKAMSERVDFFYNLKLLDCFYNSYLSYFHMINSLFYGYFLKKSDMNIIDYHKIRFNEQIIWKKYHKKVRIPFVKKVSIVFVCLLPHLIFLLELYFHTYKKEQNKYYE